MQTLATLAERECQVAALANEAEALAMTWRLLREGCEESGSGKATSIAQVLGASAPVGSDDTTASSLLQEVVSRMRMVSDLAPYRQATSLKGAAFQAVLIAVRSVEMSGHPGAEIEADLAAAFTGHTDRSVASILTALSGMGGGLSDDLLAYYGMRDADQPSRMVHLMLHPQGVEPGLLFSRA